MNFDPSQFRRHELGIFLPPSVDVDQAERALLPHMGTYLTYSELTGREPLAETEIIARLERMSAADCLLALALIGTRLVAGGDRNINDDLQGELVDQVVGDGPLGGAYTRNSQTRGVCDLLRAAAGSPGSPRHLACRPSRAGRRQERQFVRGMGSGQSADEMSPRDWSPL